MLRNRMGFCLLALGAAVLAACSTSGSGGTVVPQAFQAVHDSHRRHPVRARVYLRIPAPPHNHRRRQERPQYISPGTASISFAVQPIAPSGTQPTPMPLQTMNVTTPAPCKTVSGRRAAVLCSFTVSVMPGRDSFVVKTYSGRNASGKVLSRYSSGPTIVPTPNPKGTLTPLSFTMEGVIDHVVLQYPSVVVPADTKGQVGAIPVGVATTAPLNVTPYDAANYQILSQFPVSGTPVPYAAPFKLSVTPAGQGVTLSNDAGSGNAVTISNPDDIYVNVKYSGAFTASGGSVSSPTSFSIAASGSTLALRARKIDRYAPRTATPAPNSAGIALSGNVIPGGVYATTLSTPQPQALVAAPGSGQMAFMGYGYAGGTTYTTILGTAVGGVPALSGELVNVSLSAIYPDSLGNVWAFDGQNNQIDCFSPSSSLTVPAGVIPSSTLYAGGSSYYAAGFAQDSSDDLWFMVSSFLGSGYGETIGYVPLGATSCSAPAPVVYQTSSTDDVQTMSIAAIAGKSSVVVGSYDYSVNGGTVYVAATSPPTSPPAPSVSTTPLAGQTIAAFTGPSSVYATVNNAGSLSLGTISANGSYASTVTYPSDLASFLSYETGTSSSPSGLLAQSTDNSSYANGNALLLLKPADGNASTNLEVLPFASYCSGAAFDAQETAWTLCANALGALQFFHVVPTSTWSVLPGTVIPVNLKSIQMPITGTVYLGILEAFGATNGPFVLKNYNPNVISGVTQEGDRGLSLTLTEPSPGPYVANADVVDKNGRSVPVEFQINASYSAGAPPRPGARARARRGYPPIPRN